MVTDLYELDEGTHELPYDDPVLDADGFVGERDDMDTYDWDIEPSVTYETRYFARVEEDEIVVGWELEGDSMELARDHPEPLSIGQEYTL